MKTVWTELTIVTSCTGGYGKYLEAWTESIIAQNVLPKHIVIFTHGDDADAKRGSEARSRLTEAGLSVEWFDKAPRLDFGTARNFAVSNAMTEWVMHFDCDDTLYPTAIEDFQRLAFKADVISAGYTLTGLHISRAVQQRERLYKSAIGMDALNLSSIASGVSPFRRSFWERSPYRTDMVGAWDTALWIGFAKLGARFVATQRPAFKYYQHDDSIFNKRRRVNGWARARTSAQLKSLRRSYDGVAVVVPRDMKPNTEREPVFQRVRAHYEYHHPAWEIVVGVCPSVPWIKGAAVNAGLTRTDAKTIIIADADCIVDPSALSASVLAVQNDAPWSMPHQMVYRADRDYTARICESSADVLPALPSDDSRERAHEGALGGGIVVMDRALYEAIGGIPLAFVGWGSEDRALGTIANTLLGPVHRGDADLLHLWHPPQSQDTGARNLNILRSIGNAALKSPDALSSLLASYANMAVPGVRRETQLQMRSEAPINRVARPPVRPMANLPISKEAPNALKRRRIP